MNELFIGLGLVFVIEGLLWALAPGLGFRLLKLAASMPENELRTSGAIAVALGVFLIWMIRG
jgi:hypothetical protein